MLTGRRFDADRRPSRWASSTRWSSKRRGWTRRWSSPTGRRAAADRHPPRQAGGAGRRGDGARRPGWRPSAPLRAGDGDRGPGRGHAGLPREARARSSRGGERWRTFSSPTSTAARPARLHLPARQARRPGWRGAARRQPLRAAARTGDFPYHSHSATRRCDRCLPGARPAHARGWRELGEGEVVAFPWRPGRPPGAEPHDEPVAVLVISEMNAPEVVFHPDSGKFSR